MATAERIGIRREAAMNRLAKAARKLSKTNGVEIADFPTGGRHADILHAQQIEWMAETLESLAGASKASETNANAAKDADTADEALAAQDGVQDVVIDTKPAKAKKG